MFSFFFSFSLGTSTHFTTCHEKFGEEFSLNSSWGLFKNTQIIWLLENPAVSCCWKSKCSVCLCYGNMTPPKNNPNLHKLLHGSACVVDLLLTGNRTTIWKRCKIVGVYCSLCHKLDGQLYTSSATCSVCGNMKAAFHCFRNQALAFYRCCFSSLKTKLVMWLRQRPLLRKMKKLKDNRTYIHD